MPLFHLIHQCNKTSFRTHFIHGFKSKALVNEKGLKIYRIRPPAFKGGRGTYI